jgi:hypothetical protein
MCATIACESRSMSDHVYKATLWPALRSASRHVTRPLHSSIMRRNECGIVYSGI